MLILETTPSARVINSVTGETYKDTATLALARSRVNAKDVNPVEELQKERRERKLHGQHMCYARACLARHLSDKYGRDEPWLDARLQASFQKRTLSRAYPYEAPSFERSFI